MTGKPGKQRKEAPPAVPADLRSRLEERAIAESNDLNRRIVRCRSCHRSEYLPTVGSGHPLADIVLIKYRPRYLEVSEGVSFFGRAGSAVLKSAERLGIDPLLLYGTNVIKCGGLEEVDGERECAGFLLEELHIVQPKLIVVMGRPAVDVLNAHRVAGTRELTWSPGELQEYTPFCQALVTPDVDTSLDDQDAKSEFWKAFRVLGDWYRDQPPY